VKKARLGVQGKRTRRKKTKTVIIQTLERSVRKKREEIEQGGLSKKRAPSRHKRQETISRGKMFSTTSEEGAG